VNRADDPLAALAALEGVPSALAAARDGIDAVLRDRGLRRTAPEMTAESLLRGAHASAVLEGSASSLDDVRAGRGDDVATASVRLSATLLSLAPTLGHSPLQALARLHTLVAAGSVPEDRLGRPVSAEAAERLQGVARIVSATSSAPALLLAAVVHAELVTAAAFASHNGVVARAAERLLLVSRGVDEKSLTVPEAGHLALRAAYESNLGAYRHGGTAGVQAWLLYAAEAFSRGAESSPVLD
jgi:hypothetical protein